MGKFFEANSHIVHHSKFKIEETQFDYTSEFKRDTMFGNTEYIVLWYGEIHNASNSDNTSKLVEVIFENQKTGFHVQRSIPVKPMIDFPIGSIWKDGKSTKKVEFDSFSTILKGDASNVTYSTNKEIENKTKCFINQDNYPIFGINNETNTMIVVHQHGINYVIHPLIFFNALYGVSKHINRVLLTYTWDKIEKYLALNITDRANPEAVVIPKKGVVGDAVFLHYLKYDEYTKSVVKSLHSYIRTNISGAGSSPLRVQSYHNQDIELVFNGHQLDEKGQTILCTEITGISMPQGEPIEYILGREINRKLTTNGCGVHKFKPLVHYLELDEIILDIGATPNNENTAIARHHIEEIGNIRKLIEAKGYDEESALESTKISVTILDNPLPERFADGDRVGFGGDVGLLQTLSNAGFGEKIDMHNFDKLFNFAKQLKGHKEYRLLTIECYTDKGFITASKAIGCTSSRHRVSTVSSVFVMRLATSKGTFLLFDCDIKVGQQTSGVAIQLKQETLATDKYENDIRMVMSQLFQNRGRLSNKNKVKERLGNIKFFKHTSGHSINWVERVLSKF